MEKNCLPELKVFSFVTTLDEKELSQIKNGSPAAGSTVWGGVGCLSDTACSSSDWHPAQCKQTSLAKRN
jgi:hypothetical protein